MLADQVRGLTPATDPEPFCLAAGAYHDYHSGGTCQHVVPLWTGIAGPIARYNATGGGQQSFIMSRLQQYRYNLPNDYRTNTDYTEVENEKLALYSRLQITCMGNPWAQALLYQPTVGGGNAGRVATYLDQFNPPPYSDIANVYTLLDYLNYVGYGPGPLRAAMQQISPERYDALSILGLRADLLFGDALMQRDQALRLGLGVVDAKSGAAWPEAFGQLAQLVSVSSFGDSLLISPAMSQSSVSQQGIGVWARGVGEFGNQGGSSDLTGFSYSTGGVVGGVDWQPRRDVILGFGAAYLGTSFNWDQSGGNGNVSYAKFGLYGSYFTPRWFVDGVFSGGVNWAGATRNILIVSDSSLMPMVDRQATSSQTGHDLTFQWRSGVNFSLWNWCLTPMAGLAYFYLNQDPFTESGADSLNLSVQANEAQTLRSTLGARLARTFTASNGIKITPEVQAGWAHDFALDNRVINASLMALGGSFATYGFNGDTDDLLVGAGVTTQLTNGMALSARYNAEIGRVSSPHGQPGGAI